MAADDVEDVGRGNAMRPTAAPAGSRPARLQVHMQQSVGRRFLSISDLPPAPSLLVPGFIRGPEFRRTPEQTEPQDTGAHHPRCGVFWPRTGPVCLIQ